MKGKVVIITGASSGIGKACALEFARQGAAVVITGRDKMKLENTESEIKKYTSEVLSFSFDVADEAQCKIMVDQTVSAFGSIHVLVNNAGLSMRAKFEEVNLPVLKKLMDVNFWGAVYCTKYALPHLLQSKGSVVAVSSIAGRKGLPGRSGYCASKFALEGFIESLRTENLKKNLHVLVVCPGFTATNIRNTALSSDGSTQKESPRDESKMMSAESAAQKIVHAVKTRKRGLVLTAEGRFTLMMNKFFPSLMDKIIYNHLAKEAGSPF